MSEPKTDPGLHAAFKRHDSKMTFRSFIIAAASVATGVAVVLMFLDNRVQAQVDAGVKVHELRLQAVEQQVPQLREEVKQTRDDIRELYKSVRSGRRSEVLEQPTPSPDGGR